MKIKRDYIYAFTCLLMAAAFCLLSYRAALSLAVIADFNDTPTIIIDAGHGQEDGGAVSPGGLLEKDINLEIALTLEKLLVSGGYKVIMIRSTDKAVYDDTASSLREKKVSDIHNRSNIVNSSTDNVLISIHQNKFSQSKYKGTQVFYSGNDEKSSELAEAVKNSVVSLLQKDNDRECKRATSSIYLLDKATVPAVLVECGFLSNPDDERLLSEKAYRNKMAYCIYLGLCEYCCKSRR